MLRTTAAVVQCELPDCFLLQGGWQGKPAHQRELPFLGWRPWQMLPFHCSQCPLQKGMERHAQPYQLLHGGAWGCWQPGCWAACQALLLQPAQKYKTHCLCHATPDRATDSKSNSASLLRAMQMQLWCDKKRVLSLTNTADLKSMQTKRKHSHTNCMCLTVQNVFASPGGSN